MEEVLMVAITKQEYDKLLDDQEFLQCLRAAGVGNWDGYDFAQELYNEGQD